MLKACLVYRVPGELGSILSHAAGKVNLRLGGGVTIPTEKGIPFHMTLRSPARSGLSKTDVRRTCDMLQDLGGAEATVAGWSSFPLSGTVFARVVVPAAWTTELDQTLAASPMGMEKRARTPHITVVKGLESTDDIDAAIDTLKYWVPAIANRPTDHVHESRRRSTMGVLFQNQLTRRAACLVLIAGTLLTNCVSSTRAAGPAKIKYDATSAWTRHYTPGHSSVADK